MPQSTAGPATLICAVAAQKEAVSAAVRAVLVNVEEVSLSFSLLLLCKNKGDLDEECWVLGLVNDGDVNASVEASKQVKRRKKRIVNEIRLNSEL